jgi:cyanobactin maturation PatA/PatG family protease
MGPTKVAVQDVETELTRRLPGLARLWAITKGRPEIAIAVLDGPVDPLSVAQPSLSPSGVVEHGTHVYSIIAGSSDTIIPGIAPGCRVFSVPIFAPANGSAQQVCTQGELAAGIRSAVEQRANIINVSASQQADLLSLSADLSDALQTARSRDVLVVAAAGNQGCACDTIPASVPGVLAVGAHGHDGVALAASNWGPGQRAQGLLAPGSGVPGACVGGGLCRASGTSFATAMVSGVAGLLMSAGLQRGVKPSGERIRKALLASCIRPSDSEVQMASTHLSGRLDVSRALDVLTGPSAATSHREEALSTSSQPDTAESPRAVPQPEPAAFAGAGPRIEAPPSGQPPTAARGPAVPAPGLLPADCGCGCGGGEGACTCADKKPQLVYAIGRLGVSFISQTRRESIGRGMNEGNQGDLKPITDANLRDLFNEKPYFAQSVVWTLRRTEVPMYAIVPMGAYAAGTYEWLRREWADSKVEFMSLPGVLAGQIALYDGQIVDAVVPDHRGLASWNTDSYSAKLRENLKERGPNFTDADIERMMKRFFGKIQYSLRNRGRSPEERAINAAATNAFTVSDTIVQAGQEGLTLRDISVERSPFSRPGSEYLDVLLTFFDPERRAERAPLRSRFTFDVSDTVPVLVDDPETWHEY